MDSLDSRISMGPFVDLVFNSTYFFGDFFVTVVELNTVLFAAALAAVALAAAIAATDDIIRLTAVVIATVWPGLPVSGASRLPPLLLLDAHSPYTRCPPPASNACTGSTS